MNTTPSQHQESIRIDALASQSGVKFGTSGARGLATDMTDKVCYAYVRAFVQYMMDSGQLTEGGQVAIAGDFRPSSPRIMAAAAKAVIDADCEPVNCGHIPTPALALYGIEHGMPNLMVTGSHIPDDRNGIKFNTPHGEILKADEAAISACEVTFPADTFDDNGLALTPLTLSTEDNSAYGAYIRRYVDFFPAECLRGSRVGVYEHSSVARDALGDILRALGADVIPLGRSESFIPVDTEAVRPEDIELAASWARQEQFATIISADGDGDRPLVSDEFGTWLRGDVAGILCAHYLGATSVATPVSSNSAVEKCGWFKHVNRTRIGSPFVIGAMNNALAAGDNTVVGYEANGGFLIGSAIERDGRTLAALPTRDAAIVPLAILMLAQTHDVSISALLQQLPPRATASDRLKAFPTKLSQQRIAALQNDTRAIEAQFGCFGHVTHTDTTDGLRITFDSGEVVHLRPSGNAPELRCYNEADSAERADEMVHICLEIMSGWRG